MQRILAILLVLSLARPVAGCETALVLAVDVSGSISPDEYVLQMQGLADALGDPDVISALVQGQDRLALVQWSGSRHQGLALPWQTITTPDDVAALAATIRTIPRPQVRTVTAIGDAIRFSLALFRDAAGCSRHVIDISGDGAENEGMTLAAARSEAAAQGVTLNAIAIEGNAVDTALTGYFRRHVITPDGFVITARGLPDYPRAIRLKLLRELTRAVS